MTQEEYSELYKKFSTQTIHRLLSSLDVAFWERVSTSREDIPTACIKRSEDVHPKSPKEVAIWQELTSPRNLDELKEYVDAFSPLVNENESDDYERNLYKELLVEATRRAAAGRSGAE